MTNGVCKYCGCTNSKSCRGGCGWINGEATICTACAPLMSDAELIAAGQNDGDLFRALHGTMQIELSVENLMMLVGLLQLAMRHPYISARETPSWQYGQNLVAEIMAGLERFPAIREMLRRGNDSSHDVPFFPPMPEHKIIIP